MVPACCFALLLTRRAKLLASERIVLTSVTYSPDSVEIFRSCEQQVILHHYHDSKMRLNELRNVNGLVAHNLFYKNLINCLTALTFACTRLAFRRIEDEQIVHSLLYL